MALLATPAAALLAADNAEISDVGAAWVKAAKANDLDGLAALYADDAVAWFPDESEHRGAAAIRQSYKDLLDTFTIVDAALTNSHHLGDANHRTNWGNFTLTMKQKSDGKAVTMTGRYTDIQEKRNGKWIYVVDHASADPPPKASK
jgi:uncharacterized protein (TIGR02246 family)